MNINKMMKQVGTIVLTFTILLVLTACNNNDVLSNTLPDGYYKRTDAYASTVLGDGFIVKGREIIDEDGNETVTYKINQGELVLTYGGTEKILLFERKSESIYMIGGDQFTYMKNISVKNVLDEAAARKNSVNIRGGIASIQTAVRMYEVANSALPDNLDQLTVGERPLLKKEQLFDPWGTAYQYKKVNKYDFEIRSAGPDKKFGTEDDITN